MRHIVVTHATNSGDPNEAVSRSKKTHQGVSARFCRGMSGTLRVLFEFYRSPSNLYSISQISPELLNKSTPRAALHSASSSRSPQCEHTSTLICFGLQLSVQRSMDSSPNLPMGGLRARSNPQDHRWDAWLRRVKPPTLDRSARPPNAAALE